mgnify:FL=1
MFSLSWWFELVPIVDALTLRALFIAGILLLLVGGIIRMVSKKRSEDRFAREIVLRAASVLVVMGLLLVLYWFFAFEQIPLLSARFWILIWIIVLLFWVWRVIRFARKTVPAERARLNQTAEQRKYFRE